MDPGARTQRSINALPDTRDPGAVLDESATLVRTFALLTRLQLLVIIETHFSLALVVPTIAVCPAGPRRDERLHTARHG